MFFPSEECNKLDVEIWFTVIPITCTDVRKRVQQGIGDMIHTVEKNTSSEQELQSVWLRQVNIRKMQSLFFLNVIDFRKKSISCIRITCTGLKVGSSPAETFA